MPSGEGLQLTEWRASVITSTAITSAACPSITLVAVSQPLAVISELGIDAAGKIFSLPTFYTFLVCVFNITVCNHIQLCNTHIRMYLLLVGSKLQSNEQNVHYTLKVKLENSIMLF